MTNTLEVYVLPQNVSVKVCFRGYLTKGSSYIMRWVIVNWESELTWILDPHILGFLFLHPKVLLCLCQIRPWKSQALTKENAAQLLTLALDQVLVLQGNYFKSPGKIERARFLLPELLEIELRASCTQVMCLSFSWAILQPSVKYV